MEVLLGAATVKEFDMRRLFFTILSGVLTAGPAFAAEGDPAAGKMAFDARCGVCHSLDATMKKSGPHLAGIVGRTAGAVEGFKYTKAVKSSGITFDQATLDAFLTNPGQMVPGTSMVIRVPDAKARADIIAYLSSAH